MAQRSLETLIEQFNRASEIDRFSQAFIGEILWAEVDGVRTTMVNAWLNELPSEERAAFEAHIAEVTDGLAKALGYANSQTLYRDVGRKIFSGLEMGLTT